MISSYCFISIAGGKKSALFPPRYKITSGGLKKLNVVSPVRLRKHLGLEEGGGSASEPRSEGGNGTMPRSCSPASLVGCARCEGKPRQEGRERLFPHRCTNLRAEHLDLRFGRRTSLGPALPQAVSSSRKKVYI